MWPRNAGVSAAVLAGGFSTRMGHDKASLPFGGVTLLEHQVHKLRTLGIEDIMISGCEQRLSETRFVPDVYPHKGPLSGIHACLEAAAHGSVLFLCVDTPLVPIKTLQTLLDTHCGGVTLLQHGEQTEPLIGVYEKRLAPICAEILQTETTKVWQLIRQVLLTTVVFTDDPMLLTNCNTPAEYESIFRLIKNQTNQEESL